MATYKTVLAITLFSLSCFGFSTAPFALAQETGPAAQAQSISSDSDLKTVIDYFRTQTYVLRKPVYVYHWFNAKMAKHPERWSGSLSSSDPAGFQYVRSVSRAYWEVDKQSGSSSMYGNGLYAAVDPVATQSYGGNAGWVLVQMHLPSGLRILDLPRDSKAALPPDVGESLVRLGCPKHWATGSAPLASMMRALKYESQLKCVTAIVKIFRDHFKIDGFAYNYSSTDFNECKSQTGDRDEENLRRAAFVLTSSRALGPEDVRVFNAGTTDAPEDRLRIQSFFYKKMADKVKKLTWLSVDQEALFQAYPKYRSWLLNDFKEGCTLPTCTAANPATVTLCPNLNAGMTSQGMGFMGGPSGFGIDTQKCETVPVPPEAIVKPPVYPTTIDEKNLLWADLKGKQTDPNVGDWIKDNLYRCGSAVQNITTLDFEAILAAACKNGDTLPGKEIENLFREIDEAAKKIN